MLKDAGCDRFTVPRQLAELEPDQVENFTRIYQEHAAIAAHHVEQVAFLERFLEQKHWSDALEQSLVPQLPWPLERLNEMRAATKRVPAQMDGLKKVRAIGEASPFGSTRTLSVIARLALEDWTALPDVAQLVGSQDQALRTEAVLAVSHWRVLYGPGLPSRRREVIEELRRCPLRDAAEIRLALLGESHQTPLPPGDFGTALATGDVAFLSGSARDSADPMCRFAAAQKLIALGVVEPVAQVLPTAPEDHQVQLLGLLERRKKPTPDLRDVLFQLARSTGNRRVHQLACYVLCYGCPPDEALQIAAAARGDSQVYQALLQKAALTPPALETVAEFLLSAGAFSMSQFGMNDVAKKGRMPADFVQRHWTDASASSRVELCKFAEAQLGEYGDEALERFLVDVAFAAAVTPDDVKVSCQAWTGLRRWYDSFGYPRRRPVNVSAESITTFFGSPPQFMTRFETILHERPHRPAVGEMLAYPNSSALNGIAEAPRQAMSLAKTLTEVMRDGEVDFTLRLAATDFLGYLGSADPLRKRITGLLQTFAGTDLDLQSTRALERMDRGPAWT